MARRMMHLDRVLALIGLALQSGATRKSLYSVDWDISGDCSDSYETILYGRHQAPHGTPRNEPITVIRFTKTQSQEIVIHTRCRRCVNCLRMRQRRWYGATVREVAAAPRTWFGTLTLNPQAHHVMLSRAIARAADRAVPWDKLTPHEQFVARHIQCGKEITKYIKRIRKNSKATLRYLLVTEAHKSGLPHYHMLVHEVADGGTVRHRHLSEAWSLGFENWRLSDPQKTGNPAYLCKYLSKSLSARVRASQAYGGAASDQLSHTLAMLKSLSGVMGGKEKGASQTDSPPSEWQTILEGLINEW